jgi:hypothetical protein
MIIKAHGEIVTNRKVSDEEKMGLNMQVMNVLSIRLRGGVCGEKSTEFAR